MTPQQFSSWLAEDGRTRDQLAADLDVSRATVYRWLNKGTTQLVDYALIGERIGK